MQFKLNVIGVLMFFTIGVCPLYAQFEGEEERDRDREERPSRAERQMMTPGERAKMMTDYMVESLDLNIEQVIPLLEVNKTFMGNMQALRESGKRDFKGMQQIREEYHLALQKVLTEAQWKLYQEQQEKRRGRRRGRGQRG